MLRRQFIMKLIEKYAEFFKNRNIEDVITEYNMVLQADWNFDKLYEMYINDWDKVTTPPAPAYFNKFANQVKKAVVTTDIPHERMQALLKVARYFNSEEWQHLNKVIPLEIKKLISEYELTDVMINQIIISGESNA